jgi:hypothetical protein
VLLLLNEKKDLLWIDRWIGDELHGDNLGASVDLLDTDRDCFDSQSAQSPMTGSIPARYPAS